MRIYLKSRKVNRKIFYYRDFGPNIRVWIAPCYVKIDPYNGNPYCESVIKGADLFTGEKQNNKSVKPYRGDDKDPVVVFIITKDPDMDEFEEYRRLVVKDKKGTKMILVIDKKIENIEKLTFNTNDGKEVVIEI